MRTGFSFTDALIAALSFGTFTLSLPLSAADGPVPTPTVSAAPTVTALPSPAPVSVLKTPIKKAEDKRETELKRSCVRHFPGLIQGELRTACSSAYEDFEKMGKPLSQIRCRLNYGEEPRLVMACLIGTIVTEDLIADQEDFKKKLQLCAEQYPQHTEIDAFLQESCLTGIYLPEITNPTTQARFQSCAQLSPERSFIGPCAVGLTLANEMSSTSASQVTLQNQTCEQYFDHRRYHLTYRSCLNARSVVMDPQAKMDASEVLRSCANIVSDPGNDNERAACVVGSSIFRTLMKQDDIAKRFQKCGDAKVSYQEKDLLACLTASSLVDFDRSTAESGCKDVFKNAKSSSRGACVSAISQF